MDIKIPLSQRPCKSSRHTTKLLFDWYDFSPFSWDTTPLNIWHLTKKAFSVAGQKVFRWCKNINNPEMARGRLGNWGLIFFQLIISLSPVVQFIKDQVIKQDKNISQWIEVYFPPYQFYDRGNVLVLGLGNNKMLLLPIQKRRRVYNIGWEINAELPRLTKWQHPSKIHKSKE